MPNAIPYPEVAESVHREPGVFEYTFFVAFIAAIVALIAAAVVIHRRREALRRKTNPDGRLLPGEQRAPEWSEGDGNFNAQGYVAPSDSPARRT